MSRRTAAILTINSLVALGLAFTLTAQPPAGGAAKGAPKGGGAPKAGGAGAPKGRPGLFFREEWKQSVAGSASCPTGGKNCEHPLLPENIGNPNLELKLYSNASFNAGKGTPDGGILMTGDDKDEANPSHMWTGICDRGCMAALRHKTNFADLTGLARITMNIKTSGLHQVRIALKLADGNWVLGDKAVGSGVDWLVYDVSLSDMKWVRLNTDRMVPTGSVLATADLSKVDEIGIVDLYPGSGHGQGGWIDVAQIEVFGGTVPRSGGATTTAAPAAPAGLPDGVGKATFERVCSACHGADIVMGSQETKAHWEEVVGSMRNRGAQGTEAEFTTIIKYLSVYFGPAFNINSATAQSLQDELYLTAAEADAVIKARTAQGGFKSFDDLTKVAGVDQKKLALVQKRIKI